MKARRIVTGICTAPLAPFVQAADEGAYLGVGIGCADVFTDDNADQVLSSLAAKGRSATIDNDTSKFNFEFSATINSPGTWFAKSHT